MPKFIGDIAAPVGKYIKDGEEKTKWLKIGALLQTDNGYRIKLEALPVSGGQDGLWLSVFEPDNTKTKGTSSNARTGNPARSEHDDKQDDIPF